MKIVIYLSLLPSGGERPYGAIVNAYTRRSRNGNMHIVRAHWRKKRRDGEIRQSA